MDMDHPRHVLILGGGGRVGQVLLQQALDRGYRVTALLRNPDRLQLPEYPNFSVTKGDVTDQALIAELVTQNVDAVMSTLGIFQKEPGTPLADMTAPLLTAMQAAGVRRLVCMSSLGVGESRKLGNLLVKMIVWVRLRYVLIDKACQEKLIEHSGLDWTILRPPRILPSTASKDYLRWQSELGPLRPRWQISRVDAAREMLDLLENPSSIGQTWHISY